MERKRTAEAIAEAEKYHLLRKIRKLKKKIERLPRESQAIDDFEEGEILSDEDDPGDNILLEFSGNEGNSIEEEGNPIDEEGNPIDEEVLQILGVAPAPVPKKETLHRDIAERWTSILEKGLSKEEKDSITRENPAFENVPKMVCPKLNKEVIAALNELSKKRDQLIEHRQRQTSTILACVGKALQMCVSEISENKLKIIKQLNEAGRLLCDALFLDSKGRRSLILSAINKDLKDYLLETETSEYLFGENLTDKIKTAKAVQKSGKDLKIHLENKKKFHNRQPEGGKKTDRSLNWRGPPQVRAQQKPRRSGGLPFNQLQNTRKIADKRVQGRARI